MLLRCLIMLAVVASALALAACAESASALAGAAAEEAAAIAATQAIIATTQVVNQIETDATQTSGGQPTTRPATQPVVAEGMVIIDTPTCMIVQKDGHKYILMKDPYTDGDTDQNH